MLPAMPGLGAVGVVGRRRQPSALGEGLPVGGAIKPLALEKGLGARCFANAVLTVQRVAVQRRDDIGAGARIALEHHGEGVSP